MNKKGFTLVELIAVIAIIAIVIVIAVFSLTNSNNSVKEKEYETKVNLIETAASLYAQDNITNFPQNITVETLLETEYLKADFKQNESGCTSEVGCLLNPSSNDFMNSMIINISKNGKKIIAVIQN